MTLTREAPSRLLLRTGTSHKEEQPEAGRVQNALGSRVHLDGLARGAGNEHVVRTLYGCTHVEILRTS